ncbi:MAG: EAL domain-containing protein [Ilumatobacteraceae bacterium]
MYVAKADRSGVEIYSDRIDTSSTRRLALAGELGRALAHREFQLFYQPQLDISTGRVLAIEALARWPHPTYKSVPPDEFIPLVEQSGLIGEFTEWALDSALHDVAIWRELWPDLRVSVNMSARSLSDPNFTRTVERHLQEHGLGADALTLELTEGTVMSDPDRALRALGELHQLGIRIAIDDFGTGYSSLSYLKRLPVDEVKIDKSFVMTMVGDDDDVAIVRSTIDLARSLGMETVAEGVESPEAVAILGELGCQMAQGYFLSRPIPSADVETKIRELHRKYRQVGSRPAEEMRQAVIRQFLGLAS